MSKKYRGFKVNKRKYYQKKNFEYKQNKDCQDFDMLPEEEKKNVVSTMFEFAHALGYECVEQRFMELLNKHKQGEDVKDEIQKICIYFYTLRLIPDIIKYFPSWADSRKNTERIYSQFPFEILEDLALGMGYIDEITELDNRSDTHR